MIEQGEKEAHLVYAAEVGSLASEGFYVGPHIFADVPETATIAQEEIFGPVLAVLKARDLEHALSIANGTKYALTGGIFSRSPRNIEQVKRRFRVGNLYVNRKTTGARWIGSHLGDSSYRELAPRPAGRIISCSL